MSWVLLAEHSYTDLDEPSNQSKSGDEWYEASWAPLRRNRKEDFLHLEEMTRRVPREYDKVSSAPIARGRRSDGAFL
jgi:hypothetical protein